MATWIAHMRIAEYFMKKCKSLNCPEFLVGNIGPDCGVPNEDWSAFSPDKSVSHWNTGDGKKIDAEDFKSKYLKQSDDRYAFYLGYYFHLLTDIEWSKFYRQKKTESIYAEGLNADKGFIWTIKKDWYGQDHLYLKNHPECVFFEVFAKITSFENKYFDFYPDDAFIRQINYITNFYLTTEEDPDREFPYLTKVEMDRFVNDTINIIEKKYTQVESADKQHVSELYIKKDTLSTRISLHDKYSVNKYGWANWVFDRYEFTEGMKVLELACGTGVIWQNREARIPKGVNIILSDYSPIMVEKAKALLSAQGSFTFEQIDIQNIPYDDASFDVVIANHMLYHVPDKDKALLEVYRVLKQGGRFYCTTTGKGSLRELQEIYLKLEGKASFMFAKNISFTLENGYEILNKYFDETECMRYIDSLEVTDIGDLVAYIKSYNNIPEAVEDELYALVKNSFSDDGVFRISKEHGIFISRKGD